MVMKPKLRFFDLFFVENISVHLYGSHVHIFSLKVDV
jgi:hypothetical protein